MKIICFPFNSCHFYLRPDTAVLRQGSTFYIPEFVSQVEGSLALVVKINRLGRHIAPRFAHRYYSETALGFCLYAADILQKNRMEGLPWGEACSFDYSAPLSDSFRPILDFPLNGSLFLWNSATQTWSGALEEERIHSMVAYLSQYIFLKMGDQIWFELHPPVPIKSGEEVRAFRGNEEELRFAVE